MTTTDWPALAAALTAALHLARRAARDHVLRRAARRRRGVRRADARAARRRPHRPRPRRLRVLDEGRRAHLRHRRRGPRQLQRRQPHPRVQDAREVAGNSDVAALLESGWVTMDVVPQIPVVHEKPGAVTYGPLAETPVDPDVVFLRVNGKQLMVLSDAIPGLRIEGKPQCHIVAIAKEQGVPAASVGLRAQPRAHRHAADRDDVRDPGGAARRDRRRRSQRNAVADNAVAKYAAETPHARSSVSTSRAAATSWRPRSTGWRRTRGR